MGHIRRICIVIRFICWDSQLGRAGCSFVKASVEPTMIWPTLRSINSRQSAMYCNREGKPYPLWGSRAPGTLTRDHPAVAEQPDHQSSDTEFLQKPTRLWDKRSFVTSSALPDIGASENQPRGGNSNPQNIVQAALAQLAAHFSRQSLRKTCGHASLNKAGRKFCPNVFLMVGFLWPGFSLHRLWVSP